MELHFSESSELIKLTIALVAIVDIPGNVPMFLQTTGDMKSRERQVTAVVTGVATAVILLLFANAGDVILGVFGITIDAFRVLGGIVVLLIALDMLGLLREEEASTTTRSGQGPIITGIFPLAVPLFAGPGAITAVMIYASNPDKHAYHDLHVSIIVSTVSVMIIAGLLMASLVSRFISPTAQSVMNRLLGMIVGALGVEFILEGLAGFFKLESIVS